MMYMHYCQYCKRIHMLNGHKQHCPKCDGRLAELSVSFSEYSCMHSGQRRLLLQQCLEPMQLAGLKTTYRMHKYSRLYKNPQI